MSFKKKQRKVPEQETNEGNGAKQRAAIAIGAENGIKKTDCMK